MQRIGLESLLPVDVVRIDREDRTTLEALSKNDKLIVSGWFNSKMHHWYNNIQAKTLYVGFYINNAIKINSVVGCRDLHT